MTATSSLDTPLAASGEWVHIAVVGDPFGRSLYIDGVEAVAGAAASPLDASAFFFNIGGGGIFDGTGNFFDGQIEVDDFVGAEGGAAITVDFLPSDAAKPKAFYYVAPVIQ